MMIIYTTDTMTVATLTHQSLHFPTLPHPPTPTPLPSPPPSPSRLSGGASGPPQLLPHPRARHLQNARQRRISSIPNRGLRMPCGVIPKRQRHHIRVALRVAPIAAHAVPERQPNGERVIRHTRPGAVAVAAGGDGGAEAICVFGSIGAGGQRGAERRIAAAEGAQPGEGGVGGRSRVRVG